MSASKPNVDTAENTQLRLTDVEAELGQVENEIERLLARQQELQALKERLRGQIDLNARAPRADWKGKFSWSDEVPAVLSSIFKLQSFREHQLEVINATLQGRDVLCLMPSGGGKSLCYQLPAIISGGCTLVISPLLALINDQVFHLQQLGIQAVALTSLSSKEALNESYKALDGNADLRFVYATPERLVNAKRFLSKLEKLYKAGRLKRVAIDEAHCCSQWGNDFRPDYKKLGIIKQVFPVVPLLALTATATQRVQSDLKTILGIPDCEVFHSSVDRPNLFYEVLWKPATMEATVGKMCAWILEHFGEGEVPSGIVYCLTKKDTEAVAGALHQAGVVCANYHADIDPVQREAIHERWRNGHIPVIVATIAFGMGINKPDVRFVIHHSLSKSVENYYQESGRAGRDGKPARCLLLYRPGDALRQAGIGVSEPGWWSHLSGMLQYAHNLSTCRRALIARHFGEPSLRCQAGCQVCASERQPVSEDVMPHAKEILQVLASVTGEDKRLTLTQLIDLWRRFKVNGKASLGKSESKERNEIICGHLLCIGVLTIDFGFTAYATNAYLKASPRALRGYGEIVMLTHPEHAQAAPPAAEPQPHPAKKKAKMTVIDLTD